MLKKLAHHRQAYSELWPAAFAGAGTNAWVEKDVNALGVALNSVVDVLLYSANGASVGIRAVGSALDRKLNEPAYHTMSARVSSAGKIEIWNSADAHYQVAGYWV